MRQALRFCAATLAILVVAANAAPADEMPWDVDGARSSSHAALRDELAFGSRTLELGLHVDDPASLPAASFRGEGRAETELAFGARLLLRQRYGIDADGEAVLGPTRLGLAFGAGRLESLHASIGTEPNPRDGRGEARIAGGAAVRLGFGTSATLDLEHARGLGASSSARSPSYRSRLGVDWQAALASRVGLHFDVATSESALATAAGVQLEHRF